MYYYYSTGEGRRPARAPPPPPAPRLLQRPSSECALRECASETAGFGSCLPPWPVAGRTVSRVLPLPRPCRRCRARPRLRPRQGGSRAGRNARELVQLVDALAFMPTPPLVEPLRAEWWSARESIKRQSLKKRIDIEISQKPAQFLAARKSYHSSRVSNMIISSIVALRRNWMPFIRHILISCDLSEL